MLLGSPSKEDDKEAYNLIRRTVDDYLLKKPCNVAVPEAPRAISRLPYVPRENDPLIDAGTARATPAPNTKNPNGTEGGAWARDRQNRTACPDFPPSTPAS